jgi:hypothetical protein
MSLQRTKKLGIQTNTGMFYYYKIFSHISAQQFPISLQLLFVQLPVNLHVLKIKELWTDMTTLQTDQFLLQFFISSLIQHRKYLLFLLQFLFHPLFSG